MWHMGTNLPNGLKERLIEEEKWGDFCLRRDDLKKEGRTPAEARYQAILEFAPDYAGKVQLRRGRPKRNGAKVEIEGEVKAAECAETQKKGGRSASKGVGRESVGVEVGNAAEGVLEGFSGKDCSDGTAVKWAFIHSQLESGRIEDAPSGFAWALYLLFRKSPSSMVSMVTPILTKKISKESDTAGAGDDSMDGQAEYDILRNLGEERR